MTELLSVILPTYNPDASRLHQTLAGLRQQSLLIEKWELIIIDNNSNPTIAIDLSWHPNYKLIRENKPGLTYARLKGFENASGSIIVMVDDDNILDKNYLEHTLSIFNSNTALGAIGGKSIPLFEGSPPVWLKEFYSNLALRDLGEMPLISSWQNEYPATAPIGAGMAIRKNAIQSYIEKISADKNTITDRTGNSLSSGGDNDMVIEILKSGWQVGYYPELQLTHIIPQGRMRSGYLAKLINNTNKSWVRLLEEHQINPWPKIPRWSVPLRKIKLWFTYRAWQNNVNYIKWQGACGLYDGLSE
jgi:glycosyltransferase involved in cell wall biosynthesis